MRKCKIYIPMGARSNNGPLLPIIKRIRKDCYIELVCEVYDANFTLICGDREEMFKWTEEAFYHNIPIIHLGSGILNSFATKDDIYRHMITLMSDIQLCESKQALYNTCQLLNSIGKRF